MNHGEAKISRAARSLRGLFGASAATLLAGASHALAGGTITLFGLLATTILALPLCVALAGRVGSLWRISLAIAASQFVYHWSFAGIGVAQSGAVAGESGLAGLGPHAAHLGMFPPGSFSAELAAAGTASAWMWVSHALAAALTIALLHQGERAALALAALLRRTLPQPLKAGVHLPAQRAILVISQRVSHAHAVFLSAISHRGPPAVPASAL